MTDRLRRTCEFHIPSLHTKRTPKLPLQLRSDGKHT